MSYSLTHLVCWVTNKHLLTSKTAASILSTLAAVLLLYIAFLKWHPNTFLVVCSLPATLGTLESGKQGYYPER
jgi:hypothetical protein